MSDIQEEQKRLYKRAEEIDKEQEINNKFARIVRNKMKDKDVVEMIVLQDEEINKLQDRIDKAIEYIERDVIKNVTSEIILDILQGKE